MESLAGLPGVSDALRFLSREKRWIDEQHLAVCRIPAPTFLEQKRAEWVAAQLSSYGWEARIDRAGNVTAQLDGSSKTAPLVALTAHLDTVLAPRTPDEIKIEGRDRLRGPGVADNGAGLAALLSVARALTAGPRLPFGVPNILLVANVGEEGEGNLSGMKFLCRQSPFAARLQSVLVLDGPDTSHITATALACRRFELVVNGPGGHSWSDRGTANPVHALARAITRFADARREEPPRTQACSWNFGVIEGGTTVNAIPASARVKVDLRAESADELEQMVASLSATFEGALLEENEFAGTGRVSGKVRESGSRPGGKLPPDSPLLAYLSAVDAHLGIRSHLDCASTDANVPLSMGLAAVSIGAGGQGGGAHTPGEWYLPERREVGLRRVLLLYCLVLIHASSAGS